MVLADLGKKILNSLSHLNKDQVINEELLNTILKEISIALLQSDVNFKQIHKLKTNIITQYKMEQEGSSNTSLKKMIQKAIVKELTQMLDSNRFPFVPKRGRANVVMFVGLQGAGKTTTCAKYAYHWQKKGWRTALICADTFRAGAFDQLKQNGTKVRVPFYGSYTETDPVAIAEEGVKYFKKENYEIIIVDTSGRHKQESELFDEMKQIQSAINPDECVFVMDGSIGQMCYDQALAFRNAVNVGSVIMTKLDGSAKGGGALSAVAATESPIIFLGTGEHFEDLEPFKADSFIKRLLGLGDLKGLLSTATECIGTVNATEQEKVLKVMLKGGKFTLRDFQSQYKNILKLGSINNFMSMLPGFGDAFLDKNNEQESVRKIKRFLSIMDSMSDHELDGINPLNPSRIARLARGSGTSIEDVYQLIEEHKKFTKVFQTYGPSLLKGKGALDPKILKNMGGMDKMGDLMKGLSGINIGELMKNLGGNQPGQGGQSGRQKRK